MAEVEKTLQAVDAYALYVEHFPLKLSVASKFSGDHMLAAANMSKKTSIEAALERYKKNQKIPKSSWMLLDTSSVLNKAKPAPTRAHPRWCTTTGRQHQGGSANGGDREADAQGGTAI